MNKRLNAKTGLIGILMALFMFSVLIIVTVGMVHAQGTDGESSNLPDVALPQINDPISAAELEDLQAIANQKGMSLQAAIDRYAWNDNLALAVARIREASPEAFTGAEIVDSGNAWIAFAGSVPESALNIINTFKGSHSGIAVQVHTGKGFTEVELQSAIKAAHFAVRQAQGVSDAYTSFDFATGQIITSVVLEVTATDTALDNLQTLAVNGVTDAIGRRDILNSITLSVVRSDNPVIVVNDSATEHLGGEIISSCTTGFGTKTLSTELRGISTAGHCPDSPQVDDGYHLVFQEDYDSTYGDFQWHKGPNTLTDDFYGGNDSSSEVSRRDVAFVGSPMVGQMLCRNGRTSYKDCQEVYEVDVCDADGNCHFVAMEMRLSSDGDSGGPVYYGYTAYGIHKGGITRGGSQRDIFSRADRMEEALGIFVANN